MELKAYFSDIHRVIIDHLGATRTEIAAAVAWFTDREIFDALCEKARAGVKVSVAVIGDEINLGPGGLNFRRLGNLGGEVTFLPPGGRADPIMNHKFCVIDGVTVITGSYNWSRKARFNDENITVVTNSEVFASKYLDAFNQLLGRAGHVVDTGSAVDTEATRRRLEVVRNLLLLGEQDEIGPQIHKLRVATEMPSMGRLIDALNSGQFETVLALIDEHLHKATALIVADDAEIGRLRFELSVLEVRLESLSDEKAELERRIITFNRRHDEVLGDVIQRLLQARVELARIDARQQEEAAAREKADAAARDAEEVFADYSRQHENLRNEDPLPSLNERDERALKDIYRKACNLCHPDKFREDRTEAAHRAFTDLQDAYKANDLARVREIHISLTSRGLPDTRSTTLCTVDALKAAVAEMEYTIARAVMELKALQRSDANRLLESAGSSAADWQKFFEGQLVMLEQEVTKLQSKIGAHGCEVESFQPVEAK